MSLRAIFIVYEHFNPSQPAITCSKLTLEILEKVVKYLQS